MSKCTYLQIFIKDKNTVSTISQINKHLTIISLLLIIDITIILLLYLASILHCRLFLSYIFAPDGILSYLRACLDCINK